MNQIIITLTTIPSRIKLLQPIIDSINNQSLPPDRIELYIPTEYRKRSLGIVDKSELPTGCEVVYCDKDYGPATKILPAVKKYENKDVTLIYCDDDHIYHNDWIKRLVEKSNQYPNSCIVEKGFNLKWYLFGYWFRQNRFRAFFRYTLLRIISLGLWHPLKTMNRTLNIAEGFGGVLVKPNFFTSEVFDIPDILWTVDDFWLSGTMQKNGIEIIKTYEYKHPKDEEPQLVYNIEPLRGYTHNEFSRNDANIACIKYFIEKYNIWEEHKKSSFLESTSK